MKAGASFVIRGVNQRPPPAAAPLQGIPDNRAKFLYPVGFDHNPAESEMFIFSNDRIIGIPA